MAPVNARRAKAASDAITAGKASITKKIGAEGRDSNGNLLPGSPAALKYAREGARLDARIIQARKQGNLEAIDALEGEKEALDARYGPAYLTGLKDQLQQLNDDEIEASSEKAADDFVARFSTGMDAALKALLGGGSVQAFFLNLKNAMAGSGVSPGDLPASLTAGAGEAAVGLVKAKPKAKPKPKSKRASGGYMTPGALTLVGETGPELIMGGKVMSSTRTNQMGGAAGMNITVNAVGAAADDPMLLARQLGWQLATR
jgi:hypothetical protein